MERDHQRPWLSGYQSWLVIPSLLLLAVLAACSDANAPSSAPPPPPPNGTITGRVISSDGTGGIANATIEVGSADFIWG